MTDMIKPIFVLALSLGSTCSVADAVVKSGPCPIGYYSQGGYCVSSDDRGSSASAVSKVGSCPIGYYSQGSYCVPSDDAPRAVPKSDPCPIGYYTEGDYCVDN